MKNYLMMVVALAPLVIVAPPKFKNRGDLGVDGGDGQQISHLKLQARYWMRSAGQGLRPMPAPMIFPAKLIGSGTTSLGSGRHSGL